jgi:hypothetical protein
VFPNFSLFVYGGVNFEPYRARLYESIGKPSIRLRLFPASEGFFRLPGPAKRAGPAAAARRGHLLRIHPVEEYFSDNPTRLSIGEVELGKNYALIVNNNAGLWGYSIGDTVKFVSKTLPPRGVGPHQHFISAFGEHVIGEEGGKGHAVRRAAAPGTELIEFTVAPQVNPREGLPHHEWLVSFGKPPADLAAFAKTLTISCSSSTFTTTT